MKYIDADKLRSVLQNTINSMKEKDVKGERYDAFLNGKLSICEELLGCIDSLQQEQPEPSNLVDVDAVREDFIAEVYRVLDADSTNDRANAIIDAFDSFPTVSQIQPEVDLENVIEEYWIANGWSKVITLGKFKVIARYFYRVGQLNSK